ncbi:uncharacterized protein TNCV_1053901 [Trichonephila clavipes]|nr:uncharacterized protein TNCV_1053901 [Trichonephila clavipes]
MKINTTTPIRTRIVPCHGATCATIFIMSFLIPADNSDNTPYPLDTALFIEKDPPVRYAVSLQSACRNYSGKIQCPAIQENFSQPASPRHCFGSYIPKVRISLMK